MQERGECDDGHSETKEGPTKMDEDTSASLGGLPRFEPIPNDDAVQEAGRITAQNALFGLSSGK